MSDYADLWRKTGQENWLAQLAQGTIEPLESFVPVEGYNGFPPALIPLVMDGSNACLGLWYMPFGERDSSFVIFDPETRVVEEIARTPEQLAAYFLAVNIVLEDSVSDEAESFAEEIGYEDLERLDPQIEGDSPEELLSIDEFTEQTPLECDPDKYDGHFPNGNFSSEWPWWNHACGWDCPQKYIDKWPKDVPCPAWLKTDDIEAVFDELMQAGDFRGAWLALNSHGWTYGSARAALLRLAEKSGKPSLKILARAWDDVSSEEDDDNVY